MSSRLSDYVFELPEHLIAQYPPEPRGSNRLMVAQRSSGQISLHSFTELPEFFDAGDVIVYNNSLSFPCLLIGHKERSTSPVEVLLLRELDAETHLWNAMVEPARKIRVGNKLIFPGSNLMAEVVDNTTSRERAIRFIVPPGESFSAIVENIGRMALPRYIKRPHRPEDYRDFRAVWSGVSGSVQASDASLPFTRVLIRELEVKGVEFVPITLHVGAANFRTIEVEDLFKFSMDAEWFEVSEASAQRINQANRDGKRILLVGASVLRAVESSLSAYNDLKSSQDWTVKFIFPPYRPTMQTAYLTQFHMPKSAGYIATAAFAGYPLAKKAYETALSEGFRWGCYGDLLLIL
ncbi:MAG: S-adenosylmethionine:tRNA ribosyltransferase-isomerase [Bacteroidia bacterium]|nr:S-adenosylmethionine:tRNA ribosyltransferase-isomerase [Bacteroidia bacterium]MCX7652607.1 S-adenosylmethionine:tRNA ribosyltransferase-isomerase [Bacteroidia bacterium]MDW8417040.1 S-adenosylmethionine:tRNA ribosyltransferase-isomerase [Bacteroidia bacterium]